MLQNVTLFDGRFIYLEGTTVIEARKGIGKWIKFYNHERTHQSFGRQTPEQVYLNSKSIKDMAA